MSDRIMVYCIYDVKSGVYDVPYFASNDMMAKRRFILDVQQRENDTLLSGFKDDYELHRVGMFRQNTGDFLLEDCPACIITGKDIAQRERTTNA